MAEFGAGFAFTNPFARTPQIPLSISPEATEEQDPYSTPAFLRHRRKQEGLKTPENKTPAWIHRANPKAKPAKMSSTAGPSTAQSSATVIGDELKDNPTHYKKGRKPKTEPKNEPQDSEIQVPDSQGIARDDTIPETQESKNEPQESNDDTDTTQKAAKSRSQSRSQRSTSSKQAPDPSDPSSSDNESNNGRRGGSNNGGRRPLGNRPRQHYAPPLSQPKTIPKLRHTLKGAEDFTSWMQHLKLALFMFDIDCPYGDFTYWDIVDGYIENWDEGFIVDYDMRPKVWMRAHAFVVLTIEKNCEEEPHRLIRNCFTAAEKFKKLKDHYENKMVADLGITAAGVIQLRYKEEGNINTHIQQFDERWEKMVMTATSKLKPAHQEFGKVLEMLGDCEMAKKEFLLMTLPDSMKFNQLVRDIRNRDDYTYGDVVANLRKYVPQLAWKKGTGTKKDPLLINKTEVKKDSSKVCNYCTTQKGWRGLGHIEAECRTKARDQELTTANATNKPKEVKKTNKPQPRITEIDSDGLDSETDGGAPLQVKRNYRVRMTKTSANLSEYEQNGWFEFDSGAQAHTTNQEWRLINKRPTTATITTSNRTRTQAKWEGEVILHTPLGRKVTLNNVLYHPSFYNLVSGQLQENFTIEAHNNNFTVRVEGNVLYYGIRDSKGMMWINPGDETRKTGNSLQQNKVTLQDLHERYGHISYNLIKSLPEAKRVSGQPEPCKACQKGKNTKPPARKTEKPIRSNRILERLHADLIGPWKAWLGKKYVLTIMDDYSRYCTAIPIHAKSDTKKALKEWITQIETLTNQKVAGIQADWGG